jgi:hypothetical protein
MSSKIQHTKKLILGGLVVMLIFSTFLYSPVIADDDDDDGVEDDVEELNHRDISVNYDNDDAKIESKLDNDETYNRFMAEIKATSEGIEYSFEFEKESETNETEIDFDLTILELIEFLDTNDNDIYDPSVDTVIGSPYEIDSYKTLVYDTIVINDETIHTFNIETSDGVFATTMYVSGDFVQLNDLLIAPSQFKFDIIINGYSFLNENSSLALKLELESEFDVEYDEEEETEDEIEGRSSDEQEVDVGYGDYTVFFSWLKTATVDGIELEVLATPVMTLVEDDIMFLNYPKGDEIIHDPKVGIEGLITGWESIISSFRVDLPLLSQNELLIVSAISFIIIVGLVMVSRRKKIA